MPRFRRPPSLIALGLAAAPLATALAVAPVAAQAGTVTLDRPCYVPGQPMVASGAAFTPGTALTLGGSSAFPGAVADPMGNFAIGLTAPAPAKHGARPSSVTRATLTVTDPTNPAQNASVPYQLANFDVDRGQSHDPRSVRTWFFSGFPAGATVYGHFRLKGKTMTNHRFGKTKGACGLLHARAAGIPVKPLRTGTWTVQLDGSKHYKASTRPALVLKISVFLR
ncbi:MAG TPA: hypothetical protein VGM33_12870 [Baekduia sp.]